MNLLGVIFFTKDLIAWSFYRNHEMIRSQMLRLSQVHFTWDVGTRRARFRCDVDIVLVHRISSSDFDLHVAELHWEWLFSQPLLPGDTNVSFLALHPVLVWLGHIQSNTGGEFNRWKQQTTFGRNLGNGGMRESEIVLVMQLVYLLLYLRKPSFLRMLVEIFTYHSLGVHWQCSRLFFLNKLTSQ